jgi:chemotaxis response regulator CheB
MPKIEGKMLTTVLVAEDSEIMRSAIRKTLKEEPRIAVVGESESFAETVQLVSELKPHVLLLHLRLAEDAQLSPAYVKEQLSPVCMLAISIQNDADSKALAESYGAVKLLDKMTLYTEMVPAILRCRN